MKARRRSPDELIRDGLALHREGKVAEAARCYEDALRVDRNNLPANYYLALSCGQTGQHRKAAELLGRVIALNPGMAEAHHNRGYALLELERVAEAEECFARAVALKPDYGAAWLQRGVALDELERPEEALACIDMAIALSPHNPDLHFKRGTLLNDLRRHEAAVGAYDRAIELAPDHDEAWASRGVALHSLDRSEEALACYDRALSLKPDDARSLSNRGNSLLALGRIDEAMADYDQSAALRDDIPEVFINRACGRLLIGDFAQGLPDYEWRLHKRRAKKTKLDKPVWLGAHDLAGETILVLDEQGLGDSIQFCRYLKLLDRRGAEVLFAPTPSLVRLMRTLDAEARLLDRDDDIPPHDFHCMLASLPLACGTTVETIPAEVPYLRAEAERVAHWAGRIGRGKLTVGICWQGSNARGTAAGRSFPLSEFAGIAKIPGVHLISLHKGSGEAQLASMPEGLEVETLGPDFDAGGEAFVDTAAVMANCDLVISCDTAVAHLAGALGVPVWLPLKFVPDWRWLLDRDDSPWYPTMRLFRQESPGNWRSAFAAIEAALRQRLAEAGE